MPVLRSQSSPTVSRDMEWSPPRTVRSDLQVPAWVERATQRQLSFDEEVEVCYLTNTIKFPIFLTKS